MKRFKLSLLILAIIFANTAYALDENQFLKANEIYMAAVDGNEKDIVNASNYLNTLSESAPYDSLIQTYLGSLESMMGEHVYMPWNKMKHVEKGSEQMDDALDEMDTQHDTAMLGGTPISIRMKIIAAHTYFRFPGFLNRYQDAKDLVADVFESPIFQTSSIESKNSIYELAAAMAEQDDDKKSQADYLAKIKKPE